MHLGQGSISLCLLIMIKLRKIKQQDLSILRDWRNSKEIFPFNSQFSLLNMIDQKKWFAEIDKKKSDRKMFMITLNKKTIGVGGLIQHDVKNKSADIAIIIGERKSHGKNYGTQSLQKLVEYGFNNLNLHRIGAEIFEFNKISVKLFEKLNFKHEITLRDVLWRDGRYWNVLGYSLLNNKFSN